MREGNGATMKHIAARMSGVSKVAEIQQIEGGRDAEVFKVTVEGGQVYAVKLLPANRVHKCEDDLRIMAYAEAHGIPIPKVLSFTARDEVCTVMEWIEGRTLLAALQQCPSDAEKLGYQFGQMHANIHDICVPPHFFTEDTWLTEVERERYASGDERVLLHLDYHPLNVMISGGEIIAVLDWTNASVGARCFDIARTRSIMEEKVVELSLLDGEVSKKFLDGYRETIGEWEIPAEVQRWARLRLHG